MVGWSARNRAREPLVELELAPGPTGHELRGQRFRHDLSAHGLKTWRARSSSGMHARRRTAGRPELIGLDRGVRVRMSENRMNGLAAVQIDAAAAVDRRHQRERGNEE
jgi:hypothetical protein